MISDIKQIVYLKKVIYLLDNQLGTVEERTLLLQDLLKEIPVSILSAIPIKDKIENFCLHYNISCNISTIDPSTNQNKKAKSDRSIAERLLQNEFPAVLSELSPMLLNKQKYYQTLETMCTVMVLSNDFRKIHEIEYKLETNFDDPKTSHKTHNHSSLSREEIHSLRNTQVLVCLSYFLQGKYLDCVQKMFQFIDKDNKLLNISLRNPKYDVVQPNDLYSMISISALLSIPLNQIKHFMQLTDVVLFFQLFPPAKELFNLLKNTKFRAFFTQWMETLNITCKRHYLLAPKLNEVEKVMRVKIYVFYLSISTRIQVSYLSSTLDIKYETVLHDIEELLGKRKANFVLEGDIISYRKRSIINDIATILQSNEIEISKLLDIQSRKNTGLKDSIQNYIIANDKNNDMTITYEDESMESSRSNHTFSTTENNSSKP